jgi:TolB-like protein/Tfp pilus assembly protein PilF
VSESNRAVFLSYASQDGDAARRISDALRAAGIEVWFDQNELRGGDVWDRQIRAQVGDCALFIPIISATTQARAEGYFRREWKLAVDRTDHMSERVAFLVPVVIDGTADARADVPDAFRAVQWTRLPGGETPPAFVERIAHLLSPDAVKAPLARPSSGAARAGASRPPRYAPLWVAALALVAAGYAALDKFVLSKHPAAAGAMTSIASLPGESAPGAVNAKSIAVLPFADLSEKHDQEYFSDGLAEELLDQLAKTPGLHVIARTSSFAFKGKSDDVPTIARKLNVANILQGSVRKSGNRLRVTTQLIRAGNGEDLWSETYDRELKDVFAVQDEIAGAVVAQLKVKLAPAQQSSAHRTSNVEAYDQYLLGQQLYNRGNLDGYRRAAAAYGRAVALDPEYVAAYVGLAVAEFYIADPTADAAGYKRAQAAADKAVQLGPQDASGYVARGFIRYNIAGNWAGAQADYEKALLLDPGDAGTHSQYGELLATQGRLPEAIAADKKAIELDPLRSASWQNLAECLLFTRDFPAAQEAIRRALEISPESTSARNGLGKLQLLQGKAAEARDTFRKIDFEAFHLYGIAMAEHTLGNAKDSQAALEELIAKRAQDSAYQIAQVYAWRGEKDKAIDWLDRAYAQQDAGLDIIKYDPLVDSLRADARYHALLRKLKLE